MLDYLRGWTKKMGGDKCITLNRKVTSVTYDDGLFTVVSHDTTTDARHIDYFHSVVCCNGHFSVPNWVPPCVKIKILRRVRAESSRRPCLLYTSPSPRDS